MVSFPDLRLRRLRDRQPLRTLTRETRLSPSQFIYPLFVTHGQGIREPIEPMPGCHHLSLDLLAEEAGQVVELGIPAVLLNAQAANGAIPFVAVDNYAGARMVTEHLIERGAKRIVHIAGPTSNRDASERERGFRDALKDGLGISEPLILPGDFREDAGRDAARHLIANDTQFDAVFAGNDIMAVDCMAELREAGFAIGSDVLVAGFDDIPLARYVTPQLTTVHSDITRLGSAAAQLLLRMLAGETPESDASLVIAPTLAVRGSTIG